MIKAVLFDLDGTLINTLVDLSNAANYAITRRGYLPRESEEFKLFAGSGAKVMLSRAMGETNPDPDVISLIFNDYLNYYSDHFDDETTSYDGVPELISVLKAQGYKLAVVTNKVESMAVKILNKLYPDCFDVIFGEREGIPQKPDPTAAVMTMELLGVTPTECVFIGDSGIDIQTAVASGAVPVGVTWGFRGREELKSSGAVYIIDTPDELFKILKMGE